MSYEYMQGMMGLSGKLGPGEALDLVVEKCGGIGCVGVTTQPVIFRSDNPNASQMITNMLSRGCIMQCSKDDVNYYCCPPLETSTPSEREARQATACGGVGCVETGMTTMLAARTNTIKGQRKQERLLNQGCVFLCEENSFAYFCCPSSEEIAEEVAEELVEESIDEGLLTTTDVVAVEQENGSSTALIAILGLLGLGVVGFAGYWFLIRDKDEDEDEDETEDETEDEE